MKKKFYNGFLLVAMLLATVGSYVSCKDYDEEAYANMLGENSKLEELVNEQVEVLDEQIGALEEAQKQCQENCEAWKKQIELWQEYVEGNFVTVEEYNKHITAYTEFIAQNEKEHKALDEKIELLRAAMIEANEALESRMLEKLAETEKNLSALITTLQSDLKALSETVTKNKEDLENAIAKNKEDLEKAISDTKKELEELIAEKNAALEEAIARGDEKLAEEIKNQITYLEKAIEKDMAELGKLIEENRTALEEAIARGDEKLAEEIKNQITYLESAIEKDMDELEQLIEDNRKALEDAIARGDEKLAEEIKNQITYLEKAIAKDMSELKNEITEVTNKLEERVAANETAIKNLNTALGELNNKVDALTILLNETVKQANDAYNLAKDNADLISALQTAYDNLQKELGELEGAHKADNDKLLAKIDSICNELNTIKESVDKAVELAEKNLEEAKAYTDKSVKLAVEELRGDINAKLADIEAAYKKADEELKAEIDALKEQLTAAEKLIEENKKEIEKLTDRLDAIEEKFENVDESLKQFVSGIILQRAENPVFGSYSFPANIQTNVLMAYYGYAGSYGAEFPTNKARYYAKAAEKLSKKDIEMLGVSTQKLAAEGAAIVGSAGKVYVTVNPSNVNFEGQILPIVNSLDEESGIKLTGLKYSDKKLTFGASTRAAVNGFYEAEATLAPADINKVKMTFDLNVGEFKETVKDIINPLDGINVSQLASTVFDVLGQFNLDLDANALKASWTDELGVTRNVYSNYNLATTAVKPLSYAFMQDAHFESFPGFDKMRNLTGKLMDKIAGKFKVVINKISSFDLDTERIDKIEFKDIDIDTEKINVKIVVDYLYKTTIEIDLKDYIDLEDLDLTIDNYTVEVEVPVTGDVYDDFGNHVGVLTTTVNEKVTIPSDVVKATIDADKLFKKEIEIPIEVPVYVELEPQGLKDLLAEVEVMEDEINDMLNGSQDKINKIIDKVNTYLAKLEKLTEIKDKIVEIGSKIDGVNSNLQSKIISFLNKLEGKLLAGINSINKTLQPVMLVRTTDGFHKLSQTIYGPTVMSAASVQFIPTSYTAEIIAPAYKKLVGVTNVFSMDRSKSAQNGDANCLSALKNANAKAGVAEILNGDTQIVNFTAEKGYIYEVTYTSVDFSGLVAAKKYYVTVK